MHTVKWYNARACGLRECHHHQTGLLCATSTVFMSVVHKNMPYDGVQVYIRNNASCAQMHKKIKTFSRRKLVGYRI